MRLDSFGNILCDDRIDSSDCSDINEFAREPAYVRACHIVLGLMQPAGACAVTTGG
jgi:hypothetical protein